MGQYDNNVLPLGTVFSLFEALARPDRSPIGLLLAIDPIGVKLVI
jgi:hypothetical protein